MIEQTELVINEWAFDPPPGFSYSPEKISSDLSLDVMRKTAPTKKGLACRFTCQLKYEGKTIFYYVAQDSYVIDPEDRIDAAEVHRMLGNSYSKFREKYDLRKLGTGLQPIPLPEFDATRYDISEILRVLN